MGDGAPKAGSPPLPRAASNGSSSNPDIRVRGGTEILRNVSAIKATKGVPLKSMVNLDPSTQNNDSGNVSPTLGNHSTATRISPPLSPTGAMDNKAALSSIGSDSTFALPARKSPSSTNTSTSSAQPALTSPPATPKLMEDGERIQRITQKHLQEILGDNPKYPVTIRFNDQKYNLVSDDFLVFCPDVIKELDLSFNALTECNNCSELTKLRKLHLDRNKISFIDFSGLGSLETLSLSYNNLSFLSDMYHLENLEELNLAYNNITTGFNELVKLKKLRVLNLGFNKIDFDAGKMRMLLLSHLKKLPKLESLIFGGNPCEKSIPNFRLFVLSELPLLQLFNLAKVTAEEVQQAAKLAEQGEWKTESNTPRIATPGRYTLQEQIKRDKVRAAGEDEETSPREGEQQENGGMVGDTTEGGAASGGGAEGVAAGGGGGEGGVDNQYPQSHIVQRPGGLAAFERKDSPRSAAIKYRASTDVAGLLNNRISRMDNNKGGGPTGGSTTGDSTTTTTRNIRMDLNVGGAGVGATASSGDVPVRRTVGNLRPDLNVGGGGGGSAVVGGSGNIARRNFRPDLNVGGGEASSSSPATTTSTTAEGGEETNSKKNMRPDLNVGSSSGGVDVKRNFRPDLNVGGSSSSSEIKEKDKKEKVKKEKVKKEKVKKEKVKKEKVKKEKGNKKRAETTPVASTSSSKISKNGKGDKKSGPELADEIWPQYKLVLPPIAGSGKAAVAPAVSADAGSVSTAPLAVSNSIPTTVSLTTSATSTPTTATPTTTTPSTPNNNNTNNNVGSLDEKKDPLADYYVNEDVAVRVQRLGSAYFLQKFTDALLNFVVAASVPNFQANDMVLLHAHLKELVVAGKDFFSLTESYVSVYPQFKVKVIEFVQKLQGLLRNVVMAVKLMHSNLNPSSISSFMLVVQNLVVTTLAVFVAAETATMPSTDNVVEQVKECARSTMRLIQIACGTDPVCKDVDQFSPQLLLLSDRLVHQVNISAPKIQNLEKQDQLTQITSLINDSINKVAPLAKKFQDDRTNEALLVGLRNFAQKMAGLFQQCSNTLHLCRSITPLTQLDEAGMYASAGHLLEKEVDFLKENETIYVMSKADAQVLQLMTKLAGEMKAMAMLHPANIPSLLTHAVIEISDTTMQLNYVVSSIIPHCRNQAFVEQLWLYLGAARYFAYTLRVVLPVHLLNIKASNIYQLPAVLKGIAQAVVFMSKVYYLASAMSTQM